MADTAPTEGALVSTIRWEIERDSISSEYIYSPITEVGGMQWRMGVCSSFGRLVFYHFVMTRNNKLHTVDVSKEYKLINHRNDWRSKTKRSAYTYEPSANYWGKPLVMSSTEAFRKDKGFIKDNKITLQVRFAVSNIVGFKKIDRVDFTDPNEPRHDLTLIINGEKAFVGKQFLSLHSPVFFQMFYGNFIEKTEKEIELKEINHKEFMEMLDVIYPPSKRITQANFHYLLKLGDRFEIDMVTDKVEQYLITANESTLAKKLLFADKYRLVKLQGHCLKQLNTIKDVINLKKSDEFNKFSNDLKATLFDKMSEKDPCPRQLKPVKKPDPVRKFFMSLFD